MGKAIGGAAAGAAGNSLVPPGVNAGVHSLHPFYADNKTFRGKPSVPLNRGWTLAQIQEQRKIALDAVKKNAARALAKAGTQAEQEALKQVALQGARAKLLAGAMARLLVRRALMAISIIGVGAAVADGIKIGAQIAEEDWNAKLAEINRRSWQKAIDFVQNYISKGIADGTIDPSKLTEAEFNAALTIFLNEAQAQYNLEQNGVKGANLNHAAMGFDARMRGENP